MFLVNLVLVLLVGWVIVRTVRLQGTVKSEHSPDQADHKNFLANDESPPPTQSSPINYDDILVRNIFSSTNSSADGGETTKSAKNTHIKPPETEQLIENEFILQGTIAGSDDLARAIIKEISSNITDLYKIGDFVAGHRITAIKKDAVILSQAGQSKVLKLNTYKSSSSRKNENQRISPNIALTETLSKTGSQTRSEILQDFLKETRLEPYLVDDQPRGLRITGLDNSGPAKSLDLEIGDVIQTVNGQTLTSQQKAYQVFKKAGTQPCLNIELLRDDRLKTLSLPQK